MKLTTLALAPALLAALALATGAQNISGEFSPNPVAPGVPVTLTITDATGAGLNLSSSCTWFTIHQGTQAGPVVPLGIFCPAVIVPVPPNGSFSFTWDQTDDTGSLVAPGLYWFEARAFDAGFGTVFVDWFCISIQPATDPALTVVTPPQVGMSMTVDLDAPLAPNAPFLIAASRTSNTPFSFLGLQFCLSPDALFLSSLAGGFGGAIGALDGSGHASVSFLLPANPAIAFQGFHLQALLASGGVFQNTNDLSLVVAP
jgi:hypothetical protein